MNNESWLQDLQRLLERYSELYIHPDVAGMSLCELWGVYCFLKRMAGE